ncbi:MAG: Uma2 family endonuclease [Spirosomataceae bacterium]
MQSDLVDKLLQTPNAFLLIQQAQAILNQEQQQRESFYNDITEQEKVEFINGEIIVHSPVKKKLNEASSLLNHLMDLFVRKHKLGFVGYEKVMIRLTRNDYEPDVVFFRKEKSIHFSPNQTLFPVPDLVVEILSDGTEYKDRGIKFQDYEAHQVMEYWIIDPEHQILEQYLLTDQGYELHLKSDNGYVKSTAVNGFSIPIEAIFNEEVHLSTIHHLLQSA